MALTGHDFTSKEVWDCREAITKLPITNHLQYITINILFINRVSFLWVAGHIGVASNEEVDR